MILCDEKETNFEEILHGVTNYTYLTHLKRLNKESRGLIVKLILIKGCSYK